MASKTSTRFLILSDTHNFSFDKHTNKPLCLPVPKVDVVLHCGDMTEYGGASSLKGFLQFMTHFPAELKLVIAGNHDLELDKVHFEKELDEEDGDDPNEHEESVGIMRGELAKEAGVTYLDEGVHEFVLESGKRFSIYVSPYQPMFGSWAFGYEEGEDRFNLHQNTNNINSIATNPVPDFGPNGVDIMMTHGPPKSILDHCRDCNVGCPKLLHAVSRARPLLHCFGHIHEGHGAKVVTWEDSGVPGLKAIKSQGNDLWNAYPEQSEPSDWGTVKKGKETLCVNASIMNGGSARNNKPWIFDLELGSA